MIKPTTNNTIQPTSPLTLLLLAVLAIFFLSSCATLKKDDCVEGNWSGIGFNDAAAGLKSASQFGAHSKACAKYKIAPNVALYKSGYNKGLLKFCTTNNGYQHGTDKKEYFGVCPNTTQPEFLKGYLAGLDTAAIQLSEELVELRHKRLRTISRHHRLKHKKDSDGKIIKKLADRIDSLESRIDSRRSDRRQLRRWHNYWAPKL
jgi:hypothetical protein